MLAGIVEPGEGCVSSDKIDLELIKRVNMATPQPGETVLFQLTVFNNSNVDATGPTTSHPLKGESKKGPLVIQGDHGPIVFRNLEIVERNFTDAVDLPYFKLPWLDRNYDR